MDDAELARALRALPPAPEAWVQAAVELPRARRELDAVLARLDADAAFRAAATADLERALRAAGFGAGERQLDAVRAHLR